MNELPQTRQSLLLRLGEKSSDGWSEFVMIYEHAIYRFCRSKGLQDADANDVTQEVLAAVNKRIESWDPDADKGSFRGWLFRVARNIAVDTFKAKRYRDSGSGDSRVAKMLDAVPDDEQATSLFELQYRRSLFHWAADQVKSEVRESTWRSFWKTAVEGLKAEQVAEELETNVGSVYTAKCRVVARLKEKIAQLDNGEVRDDEFSGLSQFDWNQSGPPECR